MQIKKQPMGFYMTNCYIVTIEGKDFIIDPGLDATAWVVQNVTNPVAILNTHGHFDHVWSNAELKEHFNIPIYIQKEDAFMLLKSNFMTDMPPSKADVEVDGDQTLEIAGVEVRFRHFPGHCPGCATIEIGGAMFSGDFIFENSIGRADFPYSSPSDMKQSLKRFMKLDYDCTVYPGHGNATTIKREQQNSPYWIENL